MADGDAREWIWNRVDNETSDWVEFDLTPIQSTDGTDVPYRLLVSRLKSSSPDSEAFVHDPLGVLIEAGSTVDAFRDIDRSWDVATFVTNHDATLSASHVYNNVTVYGEKKRVTITIVKQPPK